MAQSKTTKKIKQEEVAEKVVKKATKKATSKEKVTKAMPKAEPVEKLEKKGSLNKDGLVSAVASKTGLTKAQTKAAVEEVFNTISEYLANGEKFQYIGFGAFGVKVRAARVGINPSTKEKLEIPEKTVPYFTAGKKLIDLITSKK